MQQKILVIYYSQTGQLGEILQHLSQPLKEAGHFVEEVRVHPQVAYPFPWNGKAFFAVMPNCVQEIASPLQPFILKESTYDLIIVGYQAWFLSPSIPVNALLKAPSVQHILKDTPVITVTGARNMWISAMEAIKKILNQSQARLVGNIALVDKHPNIISFITIFYWMFTAKKERYLRVFPKPGVAEEDIVNTRIFGQTIAAHLQLGIWDGLQAQLVAQKAVEVKYNLMFIESKAKKIFTIWAKIISKKKKKTGWLVAFKYYLLIALFIAAPIILTVDAIFFKPFLSGRIKRQKKYYSDVKYSLKDVA